MNSRKHFKILGISIIVIVIVNILAWAAPSLQHVTGINWCDFYADKIFPVWLNTFGRFMDIFSFSVGEILVTIAVLLVLFSIIFAVSLCFLRKRKAVLKFAKRYYIVLAYIVVIVCAIMTLNCSMLYHTIPIDGNSMAEARTYGIEELRTLRNYIVETCNEYSLTMPRDENGYIMYDKDMQAQAKRDMTRLSEDYPRLKGYYPDVKKMMYSDLMTQSYIYGYYFPFSMEANYNGNMYITNVPTTFCHELSHIKGYIYEDEANFIAFLACTGSEDAFVQYSGYLSVLYYVDKAYKESVSEEEYKSQIAKSDYVKWDEQFVPYDTWQRVEKKSPVVTEKVSKASENFTNASLKANGVKDGMIAYERVVDLLLQYYDGKLY